MRIRVGRASKLLRSDNQVMIIEVRDIKLVKKLDLIKLLKGARIR